MLATEAPDVPINYEKVDDLIGDMNIPLRVDYTTHRTRMRRDPESYYSLLHSGDGSTIPLTV